MMTLVEQRRERLLSLLPNIFSAQPNKDNAIGAVINAMAESLVRLDQDMTRVMRDHWVSLASCGNPDIDNPTPSPFALELMGQFLEIRRLPSEPPEAYRSRLVLTAQVLLNGLTTPTAILKLAIVSLGAEPCKTFYRQADALIASGVKVGVQQSDSCLSEGDKLLDVILIDNPVEQAEPVRFKGKSGEEFFINNVSLIPDVAVITLSAGEQEIVYPGLRNKNTNENIFYAGNLQAGSQLEILPPVPEKILAPFASYDSVGHHLWHKRNSEGLATLTSKNGEITDVSQHIFFFDGYVFDEADFVLSSEGETQFALLKFDEHNFNDDLSKFDESSIKFRTLQSKVNTPRINVGKEEWIYRTYTKQNIKDIAGEEVVAIADAPEEPSEVLVDIRIDWWVRPPATFLVRIPKTPWINKAEARGALQLLFDNIERARAAGVDARIDLQEPVNSEAQPLGEQKFNISVKYRWQENQDIDASEILMNAQLTAKENHPLSDREPLSSGEWGNSYFEQSYFKV